MDPGGPALPKLFSSDVIDFSRTFFSGTGIAYCKENKFLSAGNLPMAERNFTLNTTLQMKLNRFFHV